MDIERAWGKQPGWYSTLTRDVQVQLLAERRALAEAAKMAQARQAANTKPPTTRGRR